ncbi:MAG: carboxypeptidase regulatory-like domain-containing protein, partial [Candidatus Marinimicrobia bacterium]|nr:carboxypeptidase regulatory-like domain-containing protein [Candidatus Neomarinimicrobiota bacterium]
GNYIAGVSGNVVDEYENPLKEVLITISGHADHSYTDSSGFFSFEVGINNTSENVTVNASKVGYNPRSIENVTLEANKMALIPIISMTPSSVEQENYIAGVSGNVVDKYENPLEEVLITISGHADYSYTDSSGFFSFEVGINNTSENVTVNASKVGYKPCSIENVTLEANKTALIPTISMDCNSYIARISGSVIDKNANPLEGVHITISNHVESGFTDNSGSFSFPVEISSSTENVTLTAQKVGYGSSQVSNLTLKANETVTVPTISLVPEVFTTTIQGQVIDSLENNPLEGALISVPNHYETGITDANGNYNFSLELSSSPENVTVSVRKPFYTYADPGVASGGGVQVTLKHGQTTTVPTFVLKKCIAKIEGAVIDILGAPIQDVLISVSNHAPTSLTDATGKFSFSVEIRSTVENVIVTATKPFYEKAQSSVTLEYDQTTVVPTFVLKLLP